MNIIRTNQLDSRQIDDINKLFDECKEYEKLASTVTLPDSGSTSEDELFFLCYKDYTLIGFLSMFAADESFIEIYGLTKPCERKKGLFTNLLYRANAETGFINERDFLYLSDGKSPDCQAAYNKLGFSLAYSEYIMTKHAPFNAIAGNNITITETNDFTLLIKLHNQIFDTSAEYSDMYIRQAKDAPDTKSFIFSMGEKTIGMVNLTATGSGSIYLWSFGLLPEYRKKKLSHSMLSALFSLLEKDCTAISLQVSSGNLPAFRLYRKNGFEIASQVSYYNYQ